MNMDRNCHSSCYIDEHIYVFCGKTTNNTGNIENETKTNGIERLNVAWNRSWEIIQTQNTLPPNDLYFAGALNDKEILVFGNS